MPINYSRYPKNWNDLRKQVLERANHCCEECGIPNYSIYGMNKKVILTIAHLDHDEENENVTIDRLKALCQKCHLRYDIPEKKRRKRAKKAVSDLFQ